MAFITDMPIFFLSKFLFFNDLSVDIPLCDLIFPASICFPPIHIFANVLSILLNMNKNEKVIYSINSGELSYVINLEVTERVLPDRL